MKVYLRHAILLLIIFAGLPAITGCGSFQGIGVVTSSLYQDDSYVYQMQPLANRPVQLFSSPDERRILVVYEERSDRTGHVNPKAYYLYENKKKTDYQRRPVFISLDHTNGMTSIPIGSRTTNAFPPGFWVEMNNGNREFTLYNDGQPLDRYVLPIYEDGRTKTTRALLTPPAVIADVVIDATIVGFFAAVFYAYLRCGG